VAVSGVCTLSHADESHVQRCVRAAQDARYAGAQTPPPGTANLRVLFGALGAVLGKSG